MTRCEVCEGPATVNCSGLDVPIVWFCDKHGTQHEAHCTSIREGSARLNRPDATEEVSRGT